MLHVPDQFLLYFVFCTSYIVVYAIVFAIAYLVFLPFLLNYPVFFLWFNFITVNVTIIHDCLVNSGE